jgi:hypothetical protein
MTAPKLLPDPEVSFAVPAFPTITKNISSGRLTHLHHVEVEDGVGKSFPANFAQFSEGQTRFVRAIRPIVLVSGEPPYLLSDCLETHG